MVCAVERIATLHSIHLTRNFQHRSFPDANRSSFLLSPAGTSVCMIRIMKHSLRSSKTHVKTSRSSVRSELARKVTPSKRHQYSLVATRPSRKLWRQSLRLFFAISCGLTTDHNVVSGVLFPVRSERAQGEVVPITLVAKRVVPGVKSNYSMEVVRR